MAIPYPMQSNGSAVTRLSRNTRPTLTLVEPDSDGSPQRGYSTPSRRSTLTTPSYARPGALTPNAFQRAGVSYGQPLKNPPPVFTVPDTPTGTSYLSLGSNAARQAARGLAALQLLDLAEGVAMNVLTTPPGLIAPSGGYWAMARGPHYYGWPYVIPPGSSEAVQWNWGGFIDSQAIFPTPDLSLKTQPWWNTCGLWYQDARGNYRFAQHSAWYRVPTAALAQNVVRLSVPAAVAPSVPAWVDPLATPIGGSAPAIGTPFALIPKIVTNPYRATAYQTQRGYGQPAPRPAARPAARPGYGWGATIGVPRPGFQNRRNPVNPIQPTRPRPPKRKEREEKWRPGTKGAMAKILTAVGAVTEGLDLVNAMHKALPKEYKTGYYELHYRDPATGEIKTYMKYRHKASMTDKIRDLIANGEHVDGGKAISNIVDAQIQDHLLGQYSQQVAKARGRLYVDVNREANKERAGYGKQYRKYVPRRRGEDFRDTGPHGRGFETGNGYRPEGDPLEGGPRW